MNVTAYWQIASSAEKFVTVSISKYRFLGGYLRDCQQCQLSGTQEKYLFLLESDASTSTKPIVSIDF